MQAIINGKVEFDCDEYVLKSVDSSESYIRLQPITCLVLTELLLRNGTIISREELLENIWVGRGYSPSNASLNNNIAAIRKAYLNLTGEELNLLTVPKQGYEFKCELELKHKTPSDLTVESEVTNRQKWKSKHIYILISLLLPFVFYFSYNLSNTTHFIEFKQKKYTKIQSLGSCVFYGYNYAGLMEPAEKESLTAFASQRCQEKNGSAYDVFVDLNTKGAKYNFLTSCKKDEEGEYARCINYRVTYTVN